MSKNCLQVFAKAPIAGFCKTRIAHHIGDSNAAQLQADMINSTLLRLSSLLPGAELQLWCIPDDSHEYFQEMISKYSVNTYKQHGESLGEILDNAAKITLDFGYQVVIQVGTDCPELDTLYVEKALEYISEYDIVIGPAMDGGYVLFVQKDYHPDLYSGIEWGTTSVLRQLTNNIKKAGLRYILLDELADIDTIEDLHKYKYHYSL